MEIVVVTHYTMPHLGGIEVLSYNQSKSLVESGHSVTLISSRTNHELQKEVMDGVKVLRFSACNFLEDYFGVPYPIFFPGFVFGLARRLQKSDTCIIHSMGFMSSFMAALLCKIYKVPYVLIQNNQYIRYQRSFLNLLETINDKLFGKFVAGNADQIFSVSLKTKHYVEKITGRQVSILRNFADPAFYVRRASKQMLRKNLKLPMEKIIVFTCGRLISNKSIDTVLKAAYLLRKQSQVHFLIIGDGPNKLSLKQYIQQYTLNNVLLMESVPHEKIHDYFHASDIFALPSKEGEGCSIAILEAMASSLPVITTEVANQDGIFVHEKNSFLVDINAPESVANILLEYVNKPEELSIISQEARDIVYKHYSLEAHAKQLEACLLKLLRNSGLARARDG